MSTSPIAAPSYRTERSAESAEQLTLLLGELRLLVQRLGLKDQNPALAETLRAAQDRLGAPRGVALLVSERADLKRRFLERLLGPVPELPECTAFVCRLEYGAEPDCVVPLPEGLSAVLPLHQVRDFLARRAADLPPGASLLTHLPSPALERGLAVIDTPPLAQLSSDALSPQSDAALLVVGPECTLEPESHGVLRALSKTGATLDVLVEEGGALSAAARESARAVLSQTLAECGLEHVTVTVLGSGAGLTDDALSQLPARLVARGWPRWLREARAAVDEALEHAESATGLEIRLAGFGLRQHRLRRGLKDLAALRDRLQAIEALDSDASVAAHSEPVQRNHVDGGAPMFVRFAGGETGAAPKERRSATWQKWLRRRALRVRQQSVTPASATDAKVTAPTLFQRLGAAPARRPAHDGSPHAGHGWPVRVAGGLITAVFVCLLLWAFWPHAPFAREEGGQWGYHPPAPAAMPAEAVQPPAADPPDLTVPPVEAETEPTAGASDLSTHPVLRPRAATRIPLAKPIPDRRPAGTTRPRRRRDFLGIGKLWHWVRHSHSHTSSEE